MFVSSDGSEDIVCEGTGGGSGACGVTLASGEVRSGAGREGGREGGRGHELHMECHK